MRIHEAPFCLGLRLGLTLFPAKVVKHTAISLNVREKS